MNLRRFVLMAGILLVPALAHANDFGILRTAIPVDKGVWRLGAGGVVSLEDNGREAVVFCGATGLSPKADAEAKLSFSGDDFAIGGDVNFSVFRVADQKPVDLSVGGGYHYLNHDSSDVSSVDITVIASKQIQPKLAVYGAFDIGFADISGDGDQTFNLVPGVFYTLNEKMAVGIELGIGLNDAASNYLGAIFHYYMK
jgi:hypothetical protein